MERGLGLVKNPMLHWHVGPACKLDIHWISVERNSCPCTPHEICGCGRPPYPCQRAGYLWISESMDKIAILLQPNHPLIPFYTRCFNCYSLPLARWYKTASRLQRAACVGNTNGPYQAVRKFHRPVQSKPEVAICLFFFLFLFWDRLLNQSCTS
jgi:hypothetical protein